MAVAGRQMALRAGAAGRLWTAVRHNLRHRRMLVRKPVGRIERIVDLRLGVFFGAAGGLLQLHAVERLGLGRHRIGPIHIVLGERYARPQHGNENAAQLFHGNAYDAFGGGGGAVK